MDKVMKKLNYILLTLLLIISILIPSPVYAATQDRAIQGEGSQTQGTYVGGAADYTNLNSDDANTSYLKSADAAGVLYHSYNMTDFTEAYSIINSVTITARIRSTQADVYPHFSGYSYLYVRISSANYIEQVYTIASYVNYSKTWTTNPSTGNPWTAAEINAAEFGVGLGYGGYYTPGVGFSYKHHRCTYFYTTVDYVAASAPSVTTNDASGILYDGDYKATLNGEVTDDGGGTIDYYGFVWDTSDKGDGGNVDPSTPPGTWSNGWKSGSGDYGESDFSHQIDSLVKGTEYYFRAAAHNSIGWTYGDAVSFVALDDPSIITLAATNVSATTARLNASVTDDGSQDGTEDCTVVFCYKENGGAHYANYAAILGAGGTEVTAAGTYNTGELPYYDISGITVATNVDFAVKINNDVSTQYGSVLYFTTETGVEVPTNFVAVPTSTTISLSWVKGVGATNTFIRYSDSTYPTTIAQGLGTIYAGVGNSYLFEDLIPGKNYYFSAWGLTFGTYSATYVSVMATCLATGATGAPDLPSPDTPGSWDLTPSTTAISNLPFHEFADYFADSYDIPQTTLWYGLVIMFSVAIGLFAYWRGNQNVLAGMLVCAVGLAIGAIVWQLVYLWVLVFFLMAGFSMVWLSHRYS